MTGKPRTDPLVIASGHDGAAPGVRAVIHPPRRASLEGDWYCAVQCPFLFKDAKRVYGETPELAERIALSFVRARLGLAEAEGDEN